MVSSELEHRKKSMAVGYVLWFFLGYFAAHRFYMGKIDSAIGQFILNILVIGLIWWLIDAFLLYQWIQKHNEEQERRIIQQVLSRRTIA